MDSLWQANNLILTANSRLTRSLSELANQYFLSTRRATWETPKIMPLMSWLTQQFHQNSNGLILLTDLQEKCIWENIIAQSDCTPELLNESELATLVKEAYTTLTLWQIPLEALEPFHTQLEVSCLLKWINAFDALCTSKQWITGPALPNYILKQDQQEPITLPDKIILSGFDTLNPSLEKLFNQFQNRTQLDSFEPSTTTKSVQQVRLDNTEVELITMAKWMKSQWEKNPGAKLGCIIPELSSIRAQVERVMTSIFCADNILPTSDITPPPFNISAGTRLSQNNLIHTALKVLTWCHQKLPLEEIAPLLQSPYLCANEIEASNNAEIDATLRAQNRLSAAISDLFNAKNTKAMRWHKLLTATQSLTGKKQKPSAWKNDFVMLLKTTGWPGSQTQSSHEFQVLERFKKLLQSFNQLDLIYSDITYPHALSLLKTYSQHTIFQPKSHNEPIQIMGALEASGIIFDAVWVLGLHDGIWPPASKPNPLIPYSIQQNYQTPHATAARELAFCEQVTKRLASCAQHIIFSSPQKKGDQHLFPSRLLAEIPIIEANQLTLTDSEQDTPPAFNHTEIQTDEKAPELTRFNDIQGGSSILKLQALCPFKAFASIRLNARALNQPKIGVPAPIRGILTHQVLQTLWIALKTQATLNTLNESDLNKLINSTIEKTFKEPTFQTIINENKHFFEIEQKRLSQVISEWMQIEKKRPPFKVIELECSSDIKIKKLPMTIRLDRIDELADGSWMLIDYKTGKNEINAITKEKLTDPQLPIYTVFNNQNNKLESIAFAGVNQTKMGFNGITHENKSNHKSDNWQMESIAQKKNELHIHDWAGLITHWKNTLNKLTDDFCNGHAKVDPVEPGTCKHCELKTLCRRSTYS